MGKFTTLSVDVATGDCDPSGYVQSPRTQSWLDSACRHFFESCGVLPGRDGGPLPGIVDLSLLEQHARFVNRATYGERLTITTRVREWRPDTFVQVHVVTRGEDLICESTETRIFCVRDAQDRRKIRAIPVPEDIRRRCE
mgnify:CR=1 FL=1